MGKILTNASEIFWGKEKVDYIVTMFKKKEACFSFFYKKNNNNNK